jgi:hypothetical protein
VNYEPFKARWQIQTARCFAPLCELAPVVPPLTDYADWGTRGTFHEPYHPNMVEFCPPEGSGTSIEGTAADLPVLLPGQTSIELCGVMQGRMVNINHTTGAFEREQDSSCHRTRS